MDSTRYMKSLSSSSELRRCSHQLSTCRLQKAACKQMPRLPVLLGPRRKTTALRRFMPLQCHIGHLWSTSRRPAHLQLPACRGRNRSLRASGVPCRRGHASKKQFGD
eukprot:1155964-Pelagomonas_calceolata.AAC.3